MQIKSEPFEKGYIVTIDEKRIDMTISRTFRETVEHLIAEKPKTIIFDLQATDYMDSSALGTLISLVRQMRALDGEIRIVNLSTSLRSLFRLSKVEDIFTVYETIEEAKA